MGPKINLARVFHLPPPTPHSSHHPQTELVDKTSSRSFLFNEPGSTRKCEVIAVCRPVAKKKFSWAKNKFEHFSKHFKAGTRSFCLPATLIYCTHGWIFWKQKHLNYLENTETETTYHVKRNKNIANTLANVCENVPYCIRFERTVTEIASAGAGSQRGWKKIPPRSKLISKLETHFESRFLQLIRKLKIIVVLKYRWRRPCGQKKQKLGVRECFHFTKASFSSPKLGFRVVSTVNRDLWPTRVMQKGVKD